MKEILVIGGSSGIGKAVVEKLLVNGDVAYATYNLNPVNEVNYHHLDVTSDEYNLDFVSEELHGLVYCPGSINLKPFHRIKPEEFVADLQLQTIGAIRIIQQVLPNLKAGKGSVVMFSTVAVQQGFNFHSQVAVSKGAIEGLTRSLAAELAPTIRVNCVAPSLTDTPLAGRLLNSEQKKDANAERHPLKRIGTSEDIANAVAYLLSDESSWVTGQVIKVDGGISTIKG
ncbi:MAG: NAD(P)-dependent dehydrogenase (short-subunit alcohol dehydrogenase family) [Granulosicoccus sp.]|jgi:NAD(P)-dependent dehydrogenase (short-subunit alcohol dehydrogenase family)